MKKLSLNLILILPSLIECGCMGAGSDPAAAF